MRNRPNAAKQWVSVPITDTSEIRKLTPEEAKQAEAMSAQAEFLAQHGQAFVNDASLPKDTVRLKPGEQVHDAMLYSAKPKYPLGGTEIVRVIRSDGSFAGWACMFVDQVVDLHKQARTRSQGRNDH
jgi:hypothetical protein